MRIDRSNYETWLIDWLDGNLNDLQVAQLELFLKENPELGDDFNELNTFTLKSSENTFPDKDRLKKSTADLPFTQFEYLCVAYLENDISAGQQTELFETIELDPEKKRSFEIFQKMKLIPADDSYKYRYKLKKRTVFQNVIRLSVIGLSAAATIALVIMTRNTILPEWPDKGKDGRHSVSQDIVVDSTSLQLAANKSTDKKETENKNTGNGKSGGNRYADVQKNRSVIQPVKLNESLQNDSFPNIKDNSFSVPGKIKVYSTVDIKSRTGNNTLIAYNPAVEIPADDYERSKLNRFVSKIFHEKILKEPDSNDNPLKGYEIAEAGINGLNKFFGWEMALDEKKDETGELKSVYFSSKLLKFNAPVKNTEPLQ